MASLPVQAIVFTILGLGLALIFAGIVGAVQWLRIGRRGVAAGAVSLTGRCQAVDGGSLTAPVTAEPALCYAWRLEREGGRLTRPVWQTVEDGAECVPFELADEADSIRVEPAAADLDLADDHSVLLSEPDDLPAAVADRLETGPYLDGDDRFRLVEAWLDPGDRISVTGHLSREEGETPTVAGPASPSLLGRLLGVPFVVADADRDGGAGRLRDRAIAGFVLGLPPTLLSIVLLFPPEIGG